MKMRKFLCLGMAVALCGAGAMAEEDLQVQLDAANARIAELEAQVEAYKPYYDAQIVVEYDGGVVTREEAMALYEQYASMYAQYGIDLAAYGYDTQMKQTAADSVFEDAVLKLKAAELGLDTFTDEELAAMQTEAQTTFDSYVDSYLSYTYGDEVTDEQRAEGISTMETVYGYTVDSILESAKETEVINKLRDYVIKDVTVSDEDIQASYDAMVEQDNTDYATESNFVSAMTGGSTIVSYPEGYRMIKQVLVKFSDDQSTRYNELKSTVASLEAELESATAPATEAPAEATDAEATDAEATAEATEAPRAVEEIQADLDAANAEIEALYTELQPKVQEVVDAFNAGTSFDELIEKYNDDKGQPEAGYPVKAESTYFDPAFANAAMAIAEIGQIGEPANGSYGTYITYYAADVTPGAVALEDVKDAVAEKSLSDKQSSTYSASVQSWKDALNPVFHYDNMK